MTNFWMQLDFYLNNTTLHGFSYVKASKTKTEKIFWIFSIITSLICCMFLLERLTEKVQKTPIVIVQPDEPTHIKDIPFPAISFCASTNPFNTYETVLVGLNSNVSAHPENIISCFNRKYCSAPGYKDKYRIEAKTVFVLNIRWLKEFQATADLTVSPYGWCQTFNAVGYDEMFHEKSTSEYFGYKLEPNQEANATKPPYFTTTKRNNFVGYIEGVSMGYVECNFKFACNLRDNHITVVLHSPYEMVDRRSAKIDVEIEEVLRVSIEPQIRITDRTLLDLDVDDRRCYKPNEKKLKYFKTYTSINCLRECESSFILQKCSCVPYYFINNDTSLICSLAQLECFNREYDKFVEATCKCYQPCEDIQYDFVSQRVKTSFILLVENFLTALKVVVNFKDDSFYPQIRRKYFTMIDWFSFVGGILGLFFGFSFLSAFEVIYYVWKGLFSQEAKFVVKNDQFSRCNAKYWNQCMKGSSIHGLSYIHDNKMKTIERFAWLTSFILSVTSCAFMIYELYEKFTIDTISLATDYNYINLTEIPFPAVTFMPPVSLGMIGIEDTSEIVDGIEIFDWDAMQLEEHVLLIIMNSQKLEPSYRMYYNYTKALSSYSHKIVPLIKKYSAGIYDDDLKITWDEDYAVPTAALLTTMMIGHSFNIAAVDEIFNVPNISTDFIYHHAFTLKGGMESNYTKHPWTSPIRNREILTAQYLAYIEAPFIYIHWPFEYPMQFSREDLTTISMNLEESIEVLIVPEITTYSHEFEALPLSRRMCIMDDERKLNFFKIYTQRNCEIECLSEKLLETCGCVPYDVIRRSDAKVCELFDYVCVGKVKSWISQNKTCKCLPSCRFISYNLEIRTTRHTFPDVEATISFKFKENEFVSMQRIRQFTIFDFLSYIGGLLGLFAGISVLSLFEILYFFTLRLICEIYRVKKAQNKVGDGNLLFVEPIFID